MRGGAGASSAGGGKQQTRFCLSVTMEMKKSIMGYSPGGHTPFLKVTLSTPTLVSPAKGIMESGLSLGTEGLGSRAFLTYESNVMYTLRFMVDKGVVGGCWVTLPKGKYALGPRGKVGVGVLDSSGSSAAAGASSSADGASHSSSSTHATATHCQIEAHVHARDLIAHAPEGEWARLAPLRVLSFDIECAGRKVRREEVLYLFFSKVVSKKSRETKNSLSFPFCFCSFSKQTLTRATSRSRLRTR
jgi:DNA polymerase delta subunit 1